MGIGASCLGAGLAVGLGGRGDRLYGIRLDWSGDKIAVVLRGVGGLAESIYRGVGGSSGLFIRRCRLGGDAARGLGGIGFGRQR